MSGAIAANVADETGLFSSFSGVPLPYCVKSGGGVALERAGEKKERGGGLFLGNQSVQREGEREREESR